jgi:hypothetical protein
VAQKERQSERQDKASLLNQLPVDFAETANEQLEEFADVQTELLARFEEANKWWLDRVQAEANFTSDVVSKLSSARSIPDAITACQDWSARRFEMMAEDASHILDDTQKFMQMGAHILASGFGSKSLGKGLGVSS